MLKSGLKYLVILTILLCFSTAYAEQYYFKFNIKQKSELKTLTKLLSISKVDNNEVTAYANDEQLAIFKLLGYDYQILTPPGKMIIPEMAKSLSALDTWDIYPTYDQYVTMMNQFAADYPSLCQIIDAGTTVEGRKILFAKISDNVATEEDEPEVLYSSTMHGDETAGYVLMLRLIDYLLSNYSVDSDITNMVNEMEIWINPNANPDGTYHDGNHTVYGAIRHNANFVDLNRNFPDRDGGDPPDGKSWQPETITMMNLADEHNFVISANMHGGVEVVNYPWDTWIRDHADVDWFISVSRDYADSAHANSPSGYMEFLDNGITNGYLWYTIEGGPQHLMNDGHDGCEVALEISNTKLPNQSTLPQYWNYNKAAFLNYLKNALYGIRGVVTDINTGLPVDAVINILNHDIDSSHVRTDPDVGDYHRMLSPGSYAFNVVADGYLAVNYYDVEIATYESTVRIDVQLTSGTDIDLDGVDDNSDNCPGVFNPEQTDIDNDDLGALCDNCPEVYNPDQADYDNDGDGDFCDYICGDADYIDGLDIGDLIYLVDYMFDEGPAPILMFAVDVDSDEGFDIGDLVYLVDFMFYEGPDPVCSL